VPAWESRLPPELLRLPEELARVDALLDDPAFFVPFAPRFHPVLGRPAAPVECYLRLMFGKADAGLLAKAAGKLVRAARRVQAAGGAAGTVMSGGAAGRRAREMAATMRARARLDRDEASRAIGRATGDLADLAEKAAAQAARCHQVQVADQPVHPPDDHLSSASPRSSRPSGPTPCPPPSASTSTSTSSCIPAQALLAAFRNRLGPGYPTATPDTYQRRFLETSGAIINDTNTIAVILNRRAYSPVLRQSDLHADTAVPGGKAVTSASSSANRRHDSLHRNPR
jgi:hypothetical protein